MDEMKKCTQCGAELPGDALFCPDCGTRQSAPAAVPAYQPRPVAPSTQTPPPAAGFQYATPNNQQGGPNPYSPQPGMPGAQQPYPSQQNPAMAPIVPLVKKGRKMPLYAIIVSGVLVIGLLYWFLNFFNMNLPPYDFDETRSGAVVFAFILMSLVSVFSAVLLRVQLRGGKLFILADILLGIIVIAMLYGISVTVFSENNLFFKLFLNITK